MKKAHSQGAICLDQVSKHYGRAKVLDNVSFVTSSGCVVGIAAANGAGKSTLIDLVAGFSKPTSGTVTVCGLPVRSRGLRGQVAVLSQRLQLRGDERVRDFLDYLARLSFVDGSQVRKQLDQFELNGVANARCGELSVGFQRRVALAAALLGDPRVVLLDEPTAGLEPAAAMAVRKVIRELKASATVLVTSPNPDELDAVCDEVLGLRAGQLVPGTVATIEAPKLLRLTTRDVLDPASLMELDGVEECVWDERTLTLAVHLGDAPSVNVVAHSVLDALVSRGVRVVSINFLSARETILSTWMESPGGGGLSRVAEQVGSS